MYFIYVYIILFSICFPMCGSPLLEAVLAWFFFNFHPDISSILISVFFFVPSRKKYLGFLYDFLLFSGVLPE